MKGFMIKVGKNFIPAAIIREIQNGDGYIVLIKDDSHVGYKIIHTNKIYEECELDDEYNNEVKKIRQV